MFRKIVKLLIPGAVFKKVEPFGHLMESVLWQFIYGFPARNLNVIGVTGTDGKTTTTMMIWKMLETSGYRVGYMATIGYGTPKNQTNHAVHMTTVQTRVLLKRIKELKHDGIEWLVLETTSHALAQNRVWGIPYTIAVMTNVGHEHLDYHGTFERYRKAKMTLFELVGRNHKGMGVGVVNADDPSADYFTDKVPMPLSYGVKAGDIKATNIVSTGSDNRYVVNRGNDVLNITTNLPGGFNVYNSLAAIGVGISINLTNSQIEKGISALKTVEGRMTSVEAGQPFDVIVDFAHTPDSFEKLLGDMRQKIKKPNRLLVMFGSAGRRDESKRALQGEIAGKYADVVVVTEEDDRDVDGMQILNQIAAGADKSGKVRQKNLHLVHDRSEAIKFIISQAKAGDTVMLLGKGHEKTIERNDGEYPWDEVAEAHKAIKRVKP